ncbi:MAG: hypothetical protein ACRDVL_00050 [Acidimicrobiia bacterium]
MSQPSVPVISLTTLGVLIALLGLFAAGDMGMVAIGLGSVFAAGLLGTIERIVDRRQAPAQHRRQEEEL